MLIAHNVVGEFTTTGRFIPYLVPKNIEVHDKPQRIGFVYDTYTARGNRSWVDEEMRKAKERSTKDFVYNFDFDSYERDMRHDRSRAEAAKAAGTKAGQYAAEAAMYAFSSSQFGTGKRNSVLDEMTEEMTQKLADALKVPASMLKKKI